MRNYTQGCHACHASGTAKKRSAVTTKPPIFSHLLALVTRVTAKIITYYFGKIFHSIKNIFTSYREFLLCCCDNTLLSAIFRLLEVLQQKKISCDSAVTRVTRFSV